MKTPGDTADSDQGGIELDIYTSEDSSLTDCQDLPTVLFAINVDESVFTEEKEKVSFEEMFRTIGPAEFVYLPSFRRVRISYETPEEAAKARIYLPQPSNNGQNMKLYFAQVQPAKDNINSLLPPVQDKQFLISPPASPPVGWEQNKENEPVFNFDLLAAVVELAPGCSHELHEGTSSTPSVVVHVCEDLPNQQTKGAQAKIQQTRRPGV